MPINYVFSLHISGTALIPATTVLSIRSREDRCKSSTIWICFWYSKSFTFPLQVSRWVLHTYIWFAYCVSTLSSFLQSLVWEVWWTVGRQDVLQDWLHPSGGLWVPLWLPTLLQRGWCLHRPLIPPAIPWGHGDSHGMECRLGHTHEDIPKQGWCSKVKHCIKYFFRYSFEQVARIMSWTQTCFGLGYMLGPAVGAALYKAGGFILPFFSIGGLSIVLSIGLCVSIPDLENINQEEVKRFAAQDNAKTLAASGESGVDMQNGHPDTQCNGIRPSQRSAPG